VAVVTVVIAPFFVAMHVCREVLLSVAVRSLHRSLLAIHFTYHGRSQKALLWPPILWPRVRSGVIRAEPSTRRDKSSWQEVAIWQQLLLFPVHSRTSWALSFYRVVHIMDPTSHSLPSPSR
jgi:hypothetical protein